MTESKSYVCKLKYHSLFTLGIDAIDLLNKTEQSILEVEICLLCGNSGTRRRFVNLNVTHSFPGQRLMG